MAELYRFTPATLADLPRLDAWQRLPHVAAWWDDDPLFDADDLADPRLALWLVAWAGRDFAYLQDYAVHGTSVRGAASRGTWA